jgi:hypothetical protein
MTFLPKNIIVRSYDVFEAVIEVMRMMSIFFCFVFFLTDSLSIVRIFVFLSIEYAWLWRYTTFLPKNIIVRRYDVVVDAVIEVMRRMSIFLLFCILSNRFFVDCKTLCVPDHRIRLVVALNGVFVKSYHWQGVCRYDKVDVTIQC